MCLDETGRQLLADAAIAPEPMAPGGMAREDYEYVTERGGVCDLFYAHRAVGRLGRHVVLGERRTRIDFAHCIKESIAMSTTPKHRRSFW